METLSPTPDLNAETDLPRDPPQTPPYTPHRAKGKRPLQRKRPLERSDSPASARSVRPAETSSPAKKTARRQVNDEVKVEELIEGDAGYITDVDVVYPHELEEVESTSERESDVNEDYDDESGDEISTRLSRLECEDSPEAAFEKMRREEHLRMRRDSRAFKRSHSQSVKSDTDVTDPEAMADHDVLASARRLRRRVRGPADDDVESDGLRDVARASPRSRSFASSVEIFANSSAVGGAHEDNKDTQEAMEVDEPR